MNENNGDLPISKDLLAILRDPAAVQQPEKYGPDPGQLELVHNSWLVSSDTGYKYPIKDGIPVMLIEEGQRWKDTPVDELPVPPETADPLPATSATSDMFQQGEDNGGLNPIILGVGALVTLIFIISLLRLFSNKEE